MLTFSIVGSSMAMNKAVKLVKVVSRYFSGSPKRLVPMGGVIGKNVLGSDGTTNRLLTEKEILEIIDDDTTDRHLRLTEEEILEIIEYTKTEEVL